MSVIVVAPLAGAWIEITHLGVIVVRGVVAPLAGAWIEISIYGRPFRKMLVAPLAGAWIEIEEWRATLLKATPSLPSRERGLKYRNNQTTPVPAASLPSRERGLK